MNTPPAIRIGGNAGYCSGVLIAPHLGAAPKTRSNLALSCAHYFHRDRVGVAVRGRAFHTTVEEVIKIPWSDIAVVRLAKDCPVQDLPAVSQRRAEWLSQVTTTGFGGSPATPNQKQGRVIARIPLSLSRDLGTFVRSGAVLYNTPAAIRGDSGGPVINHGQLIGLQSLILDPFGRNLKIATVSQLAPHLPAIRQAVAQLKS
ncbi:Trypsin [Corynebacterium occultum]|uniref:Trypsin n=1 Tax=Corynebacterium occultum TaxID=2675219 RepID=A0A6B8W900_9CORY|nr:serine protease [Corynebacterium occultum]QGU07386.1 Trypsin [Corynebacterium occultum]